MRYKKGMKIELLNPMDPPSLGSWLPAEIISGNGHMYSVIYEGSPDSSTVERVPRKAIRPCPPPVGGRRSWATGDIIEVLENNTWKAGMVAGEAGDCYYFIEVFGCYRETEAHDSCIRVLQYWHDNRWEVLDIDMVRMKRDEVSDIQSKLRKYIIVTPESGNLVKKRKGTDQLLHGDDRKHYQESSIGMNKWQRLSSTLETRDPTCRNTSILAS